MREVELSELRDLLRQSPVMVEINPLSLAILPDEVHIFEDPWQMVTELDMPTPQPTKPMLTTRVEPALLHRLPSIRCTHNPLTSKLNHVLLSRYEFIKQHMLCQSQVADKVAQHSNAEAIAVILVDGLSYLDIQRYAEEWLPRVTPVLIDGASTTEQGMKRIVGNPPLAQRLFDLGFRNAMGFTYWDRNEDLLTDRIFTGFSNRVYKVKSFSEVLAALESEGLRSTFVQIVRAGLDGIAHRWREKPDVKTMVKEILLDFEQLIALFKRKGISAWVHLVSDHGILWAHEHNFQIYEFSPGSHPRHYEHSKRGKYVLNITFEGREFALLEYPYLRRELRVNEWGVHGGLSFEESIVPLISINTGDGG